MRCLVNDQQQEVERAVCCRGKYRFGAQYKFLEVDEQKWFNTTPEARSKHISKVFNVTSIHGSYDNTNI